MSHCEGLFRLAVWKVFRVQFWTRLSARGDSWLHSASSGRKCGEVGSAVSMLHQSDISLFPPLLSLPGCIMFFSLFFFSFFFFIMADSLAGTSGRTRQSKGRKGAGGRKRGWEGGRGLEVLSGVPRPPSAKDSLTVIWAVSTRGLPRHIPEY